MLHQKIGGRPLYRHIEYEEGEQAREAGAVVRGDEEVDEDEHDDDVVGEEEREGGEKRGSEPPPDAGHDGEHAREGECVALGGADGGDDGEEREQEEREEVGGLEDEQGELVGGEARQQAALRVGARGGCVQGRVVGVDVGEERVGDGDVQEEERGEGQREGGRDAREERAVRASEDLRGEAVDVDDAQELQLLRLALYGWLAACLGFGDGADWRLETGREGRIVAWGLGNGDFLALASGTGAGHDTAADDGGGGGGGTRRR